MKKEKLTLKQQEEIFKEVLVAHLSPDGFTYFHEYQNSYFRQFPSGILKQIAISGKTSSGIHAFVHQIAHLAIENIIFEVGLPGINFSNYNRETDFLMTIRNNHIHLTYNTEERPVETEQDCIDYCQSINEYMETDGKAFVEKHSYLPNILQEMDKLVEEGKYWNGMYGKGGILTGLGDAYFRGLIISKLCNDVNFENKIMWVQNIFEEDIQWLPYYEKLKERLETIKPIV